MKKFTLFGALLVAGMATAQVNVMTSEKLETKAFQAKSIETTATISKEKFTAESYANRFAKKAANAATADYTGVDYYQTPGMMYAGFSAEGQGFIPLILLPYQDTTIWTNYAQEVVPSGARPTWLLEEAATSWTDAGEEVAQNSVTYGTNYGLLGMAGVPSTSDHTFTYEGTQHNIKGYQYGSNEAAQYVISAVGPDMISDGNCPMTLCGMFCDPIHGSEGHDYYMVGAQPYGPYANGCGLTIEGKRLDTIGSIVRNVSPMKINKINILVYNADKQGIEKMMPEGAEVKVEIFAADLTTGEIEDEPLYTTTITAENYTDIAGYIGTLSAAFYEEDIFGGLQEVPVVIEGDFYVQLTNFNESGCDFGIYSDYYTPGGTTLWTWDGEYTTLWSDGGGNLLISYDAYWPAVINGAETYEMEVAVEGGDVVCGGYLGLSLYTNVLDIDAWEVETPDWVEATINGDYLEDYSAVVIEMTAEALTEGEGRQDVVTVIADYRRIEFTLTQGEVKTGVENVTAPVFNGKTFNLLGVEVDENYKGIVIKNGQKFIQ